MRLSKARDTILLALAVVLGVIVGGRIAMVPVSLVVKFSWTLAPLASLVASGIVALLMVTAAVLVVRLPPTRLATVDIVLALGAVPILGFASSWVGVSLVVLTIGVFCLEAGCIVAGRRAGPNRDAAPGLLAVATLILAVSTVGFYLFSVMWAGLAQESAFLVARSPDGGWTVTGIQRDEGAFGGSTTVFVRRTWLGVIEQDRDVFEGGWGDIPAVVWVDWHTISLDGKELELYSDPAVSGYE